MRLHLPVCLLTAVLSAVMTASAAVVEWDGGKGLWWDGCPMGESVYHNGDTVLFTSAAKVQVLTPVAPGSVVVDTKKDVTFTTYRKVPESGIAGEGSLFKSGSGTLTLNGGNTYEGGTTLKEGTLRASAADSFGLGAITVEGGRLDLNSQVVLNDMVVTGPARVEGTSHYMGQLTVQGELVKQSDVTLFQDALLKDGAYVAGTLRGTGGVQLTEGHAVLAGKNKYLGDTYVAAGATLTLSSDVAGDMVVDGTLRTSWDGIKLGKGQTLTVNEGGKVGEEIHYPVYYPEHPPIVAFDSYVGPGVGIHPIISGSFHPIILGGMASLRLEKGSTLFMNGGAVNAVPVLAGGTVVFRDADAAMAMKGKGTFGIGTSVSPYLRSELRGKAEILLPTDAALTVTSGNIMLTVLDNYSGGITLSGGCLDTHKLAMDNEVFVYRNSAFISGNDFTGKLVLGEAAGPLFAGLDKKSRVTLHQDAVLNNGSVDGVLSGDYGVSITGLVWINSKNKYLGVTQVESSGTLSLAGSVAGEIAVAGTLQTPHSFTPAKGQVLCMQGGLLDTSKLYLKKGAALVVQNNSAVSGNMTIKGGVLAVEDGSSLNVSGTLKLDKPTQLILHGDWQEGQTYVLFSADKIKVGRRVSLNEYFGVPSGATISTTGDTILLTLHSADMLVQDEVAYNAICGRREMSLLSLEETYETVNAPAPATLPAPAVAAEAAATRPLGDALVMADWAMVDANRAFTNTLQSRRDSGVMLADGQGMAWASAMGGVARHGSENGHNGADVNLNGAAVGVEHTAGANSVLGLAVGHTWSRIGATGMQHLRQDTAHVALYGQTQLPHGFTAEWSAAYGDTDSKGAFYGTRETWSQKSTAISARLNKTHALTDSTAVRGFAGLNYDATDAASIHGMHTGSVQRLQGEVGAGITHRADKLTTYAEASVTTDLARNAPAVDFGAWRQNGATPGRTGLNLTLGAAYELTDKWSVNAAYRMEAAERATQHSFNVGAAMKF